MPPGNNGSKNVYTDTGVITMKKRFFYMLICVVLVTLSGGVTFADTIGFNASGSWMFGDPVPMEGKEADGFSNWTDTGNNSSGTDIVLNGSSDLVTVDWSSDNFWAGGPAETNDQQLYRIYLDDPGEGVTASISGLGDWLANAGHTGYNIRIYQCTDSSGVEFQPVEIIDDSNDSVIKTVEATNEWGDGYTRAYVDTGRLEADSITLNFVDRTEQTRSTLSAFKITSFEGEILVVTSHPESKGAAPGEQVSFSVEAETQSEATYQWYKSEDDEVSPSTDTQISGATSATYTISSASLDDSGYYYCEVSSVGTTQTVYSEVARLEIERLMAHWTLDQADYDSSSYLDVSTESSVAYNADVYGTPSFVSGIVNEGVQISGADANGTADAGTWNPMSITEELTVSLWVNWNGTNGDWQGLVAKRDYWTDDGVQWQLQVDINSADVVFGSTHGSIRAEDALENDEQWQHVVATYADGVATIYIDGSRMSQGDFDPAEGSGASIVIGNTQLDYEMYLNGVLDDIKIFNYAVTETDVAEMYFNGSGERSCIEANRPVYDLTGNCKVNFADFAQLADWWMYSGFYPVEN